MNISKHIEIQHFPTQMFSSVLCCLDLREIPESKKMKLKVDEN